MSIRMSIMIRIQWIFPLFLWFIVVGPCYADQTIEAKRVDLPPVIDGKADDPAWQKANFIVTHDKIADISIKIKSVYTPTTIFFLVQFPDSDESRLHKPWIWNKAKKLYEVGPDREDSFLFKWAMSDGVTDLGVYANEPYTADIWFWKAHRTDPSGHADDKFQILSKNPLPRAKPIESVSGQKMYLKRSGDAGKSAYTSSIHIEYEGDKLPQFISRDPSGSRADIRAKGVWHNHQWYIEFSRGLETQHSDDIQFDLSKGHFFGVSRYEIAARKSDPNLSQPLYGSGDVNEKLTLILKP